MLFLAYNSRRKQKEVVEEGGGGGGGDGRRRNERCLFIFKFKTEERGHSHSVLPMFRNSKAFCYCKLETNWLFQNRGITSDDFPTYVCKLLEWVSSLVKAAYGYLSVECIVVEFPYGNFTRRLYLEGGLNFKNFW